MCFSGWLFRCGGTSCLLLSLAWLSLVGRASRRCWLAFQFWSQNRGLRAVKGMRDALPVADSVTYYKRRHLLSSQQGREIGPPGHIQACSNWQTKRKIFTNSIFQCRVGGPSFTQPKTHVRSLCIRPAKSLFQTELAVSDPVQLSMTQAQNSVKFAADKVAEIMASSETMAKTAAKRSDPCVSQWLRRIRSSMLDGQAEFVLLRLNIEAGHGCGSQR